ncbi:hypothetical protein P389DRAFT_192387 [Cystobasidium minutum MCA 4210]|uniref:uncharacterized protein n=1 Tax=Cystobasidium minutum MCA 4210 TaxID=1397322 RepID=UPI0034CEA591|eukprot:jgi/Rhomi1/192387/gm1.601_g
MSEQLEFDPAMFGMKANHGMLRKESNHNPGTGANSQGVGQQGGGHARNDFGENTQQQGYRGRGGRGGGQRGNQRGGGSNRGRGGNRGGARGGRSNDGQPFKRQRFDNEGPNGGTSRGFFKPSMLEDPWQHLS